MTHWTPDEKKHLEKLWLDKKQLSFEEMGEKLGKSKQMINAQAHRMELHRKRIGHPWHKPRPWRPQATQDFGIIIRTKGGIALPALKILDDWYDDDRGRDIKSARERNA